MLQVRGGLPLRDAHIKEIGLRGILFILADEYAGISLRLNCLILLSRSLQLGKTSKLIFFHSEPSDNLRKRKVIFQQAKRLLKFDF